MRLVGFSGEINRGIHYLGSEENDIINQYLGKPKGGQFQSLLFSLILQPVRINKPGAPLLHTSSYKHTSLFAMQVKCVGKTKVLMWTCLTTAN